MAGGIAFYAAQLFVAARKPSNDPHIADLAYQKDVSGRYDDTADSFDSEVGITEIMMGINRTRKALAQQCTGHVLEVSCGTGRNLGYYDIGPDSKLESLTFVDLSPQMVAVCKKKWTALYGGAKKNSLKAGMPIRFLSASALESLPLAPAEQSKKYDTIIQTMGLCSTPHPVQLLRNMTAHLDLTNPDARILLLEHGRSYRDWLNNILDSAASKHAEIHGCWFNRDIGAMVHEVASQVGLQVTNERRRHLGTTWVFELRPHPEVVRRAREGKTDEKKVEEKEIEGTRGGWRSWLGLG